jgi:L-aspartate oxidase
MHGANRLASNSLLEGLVVGRRTGAGAAAHAADAPPPRATFVPVNRAALPRPHLQRSMTRHVSVVRDAIGLSQAGGLLRTAPVRDLTERAAFGDAALTVTASAVVAAALQRGESRGCHHRADHPDRDPAGAVSASVRLSSDGVPAVALEAQVCC